jgi:glucosamine--fructose-6-phosphate aminotransferase (isomerizing)
MDMNAPRANPYVRDILGQPEALSRTIDRLPGAGSADGIAARSTGRLILTGMGASFHALVPLYYALVGHGRVDVHLVETSELIHGLLGLVTPGATVVATSQSGRSAEIVTLLSAVPSDVTVIGVTNNGDGTLASDADVVILTDAGEEHSVSSKTYTTALLALEWVGRVLVGTGSDRLTEGLAAVVPSAATYLEHWDRSVGEIRAMLGEATSVTLVGRGPSLASVGMGALVLREASHFPATGMSSAAYRHGPIDMASPGEFVFAFAGDTDTRPLVERLVADVRSYGGVAGLVHAGDGSGPLTISAAAPRLSPILEMLPVQALTVAVAERDGRRAGEFSHIGKVTTIE